MIGAAPDHAVPGRAGLGLQGSKSCSRQLRRSPISRSGAASGQFSWPQSDHIAALGQVGRIRRPPWPRCNSASVRLCASISWISKRGFAAAFSSSAARAASVWLPGTNSQATHADDQRERKKNTFPEARSRPAYCRHCMLAAVCRLDSGPAFRGDEPGGRREHAEDNAELRIDLGVKSASAAILPERLGPSAPGMAPPCGLQRSWQRRIERTAQRTDRAPA